MNEPLLNGAALWVLSASAAASLLAVLVWMAHKLCGRILSPRWAYAMWWLVVLRLVIPYTPPSPYSVFNLGRGALKPDAPGPAAPAQHAAAPAPAGPRELSTPVPPPNKPATAELGSLSTHPAFTPLAARSSAGLLSWLWLAGAVAYLLLVAIQHFRLARRFARPGPVDLALERLTKAACEAMGIRRAVAVVVTDLVSAPALFGWWRPRLLLPRARVSEWSQSELGWIVRHELAHVKRHDVLVNWLLIGVQAVHWFNPIVLWALRRLRAERELLCDAAALAGTLPVERRAYGTFLLRLTEQRSHLLSILSYKNQLKRRIAMIAQPHAPRSAWFAGPILVAGLACLTFTRAAEPARPAEKPAATSPAEVVGLDELKEQLARLDAIISAKQTDLDEHRVKTRRRSSSTRTSQEMELQRLEAQSQARQAELLLGQLRGLSRSQLRNAALTVMPDQSLPKLVDKLAEVEQELAGMITTHHEDHPEVVRCKRILTTINQQIDARLDGMLLGLEAKRDLALRQAEELSQTLDEQRRIEQDRILEEQPALRLERDLANLQKFRDLLHARILEEEINAKLPSSVRLRNADLQGLQEQLQRILTEQAAAHSQRPDATLEPRIGLPSFNILGAVRQPGRYALPGETASLVDALALAGGPTPDAKLSGVKVMRPGADEARQIFVLDAASMLSDSNAPLFRVRPDDTIYVEAAPRMRVVR